MLRRFTLPVGCGQLFNELAFMGPQPHHPPNERGLYGSGLPMRMPQRNEREGGRESNQSFLGERQTASGPATLQSGDRLRFRCEPATVHPALGLNAVQSPTRTGLGRP